MLELQQFTERIQKRLGTSMDVNGISVASRYFDVTELASEPWALAGVGKEQWINAKKEAHSKFIYRDDDMTVTGGISKELNSFGVSLRKDAGKLTPGSIMDLEGVASSCRKDRDGDVMDQMGLDFDPNQPLLLHHNHTLPIGKLVTVLEQNAKHVKNHWSLADSPLANDNAPLFEHGVYRFSIGFIPKKYREIEEGSKEYDRNGLNGFYIEKATVYETSGVAIPANTDAIITQYSRQKFATEYMKAFGKSYYDARKIVVKGGYDPAKGGDIHIHNHVTIDTKAVEVANTFESPVAKTDAEPLRWNLTLSKAFDIAGEKIEAASVIYEWVSQYLGVPIKSLYECSMSIPSAKLGGVLSGWKDAVSDMAVVDTRNLDYGGRESPPVYESIQLNSTKRQDFLVEGTVFYRSAGGPAMVAKVAPSWGGVNVTLFSRLEDKEKANEAIDKSWQYASSRYNYLKGEAFSLSGEFLEKTGESFDGIFLEKKNKECCERIVRLVNEQGAKLDNRGVIMMGPPGTGKTLSGRALMNKADATFIWISSRDFSYSGAFGGMSYAFKMARELSPSILFIEDIDNWLDKYSVDLLKTEMDGIRQYKGVTTILTTNFPELLPEALIDRPGRFHDVLKFGLPGDNIRQEMIQKWIPDIGSECLKTTVIATNGYSGAHVKELAKFSATIKAQEQCSVDESVGKALEKIKEQRDLIDQTQMAGSRYRPKSKLAAILKGCKTMSFETKAAEQGLIPNDAVNSTEAAVASPVADPAAATVPPPEPAAKAKNAVIVAIEETLQGIASKATASQDIKDRIGSTAKMLDSIHKSHDDCMAAIEVAQKAGDIAQVIEAVNIHAKNVAIRLGEISTELNAIKCIDGLADDVALSVSEAKETVDVLAGAFKAMNGDIPQASDVMQANLEGKSFDELSSSLLNQLLFEDGIEVEKLFTLKDAIEDKIGGIAESMIEAALV